jgi:SAM-dependent methyltransferase
VKTDTTVLLRRLIPPRFRSKSAKLSVYLKYSVLKFRCPLCGHKSRKLLPAGYYLPVFKEKKIVGGGYRLDALCPTCNSSDRERLVYLYLRWKTDVFSKRLAVLHVAPEPNLRDVLMAQNNILYVSADLNSPLAMVRMNISRVPHPDNTFDLVICNHVLEHIQDDLQAMRELHRVLKPGGQAILQVPISLTLLTTFEDPSISTPSQREQAFGQADHVRIYARDYVERLNKAGFAVEVHTASEAFSWPIIRRYAITSNEPVFVSKKL